MDQPRFESASRLFEDGRTEEAAQEFRSVAEDADDPDEKAAALTAEHKCLCRLHRLDRANEVMLEIRGLPIRDRVVGLVVDFCDACMTELAGKPEAAVARFKAILDSNQELLASADNRDLYERIQERRAFQLVGLGRYDEALPILKEAVSFTDEESEPQFVQFYLGVCHQEALEIALAKEAFTKSINLGLNSQFEASARYRIAMLYFSDGALAQAKLHLESALAVPDGVADKNLLRQIYRGLSRTCHGLGEKQEEQKYSKLERSS